MNTETEFKPFPKIARYNRELIITEKIDGTNASVWIVPRDSSLSQHVIRTVDDFDVLAGSRNRFLSLASDNFGFARWVFDHADNLVELGEGAHYGEWWGQGIQRRYGLNEKRFSLFNVHRWGEQRPECCHVVPKLGTCLPRELDCDWYKAEMLTHGSTAAPGFMRPEGIVVFHSQAGALFKFTFDGDAHKGAS